MTPKLLAKPDVVCAYPKHSEFLTTQCGRKFTWGRFKTHWLKDIKVGDKVWIARRINVPTSDWCYELYEVTVCESKWLAAHGFKNRPQTNFSGDRDIVWEIK